VQKETRGFGVLTEKFETTCIMGIIMSRMNRLAGYIESAREINA
jgi:hypothetical protein